MDRSDAEIVQAVLDGDVESFRFLVERHQESIFKIAMRYTGNTVNAEDISQEAFVRSFENLARLRDPEYFFGWLRQIAVRLCLDWLRARNGRHSPSLDTLREQGLEVGVSSSQPRISTVESDVHRKDVQQIVLDEISRLPEESQEILAMRYFEGMSVDRISKSLDMKLNTVKVKLYRAREALRSQLENLYSAGELTTDGLSIRPI